MSHRKDAPAPSRKARQHTIIIASGETVRHVTVRGWMAVTACGIAAALLVVYLAAASYLFFRDDLIDLASAHGARIEHAYEDRIATLRAQVERLASRDVIDRDTIEKRIETLYARQATLSEQHSKLAPLLARARSAGIMQGDVPIPEPRPSRQTASAGTPFDSVLDGHTSADADEPSTLASAYVETPSRPAAKRAADPDSLVGVVATSLRRLEGDQDVKVRTLTERAELRAGRIQAVLQSAGLPIPVTEAAADKPATHTGDTASATSAKDGVGGPYIPLTDPAGFDTSLTRLDTALDKLETVRRYARKMPFGQPLPVDIVTSPFGRRDDPFLGEAAFHPGVDLRAPDNSAVHATGAGTVTIAGWINGYGNMVEIDHGNGIMTRYGHLSELLVKKGDVVAYGEVVGRSGSTGRSTGPHLHYEVRLDNQPVNPMRFLDDGLKLNMLLRG